MDRSDTLPVVQPQLSESSKPPRSSKANAHTTATSTADTSRINGPNRQNSVPTRYMSMLLDLDTIPRMYNILASFFTWILLAGFVIFPGTFTAIQSVDDNAAIANNQAATTVLASFKNAPLLAIAGTCCGIGAGGMLWLYWKWRENYVWLLNKIFLPGCLNSLAGLISTITNVYAQQNGTWSTTAQVTGIVTGSCMTILAVLFALYNFWVLEKVKRSHGREMRSQPATEDETFGEKVERKAKEPGLEPGSVV